MLSTFAVFGSILVAVSAYDGCGGSGGHGIEAAVKSSHSIRTIPVMSSGSGGHRAAVIDINSSQPPLTLRFNSQSSNINSIQKHQGSGGKVQKSSHTDEPDKLINNVNKPVIQRVHEVVSPMRIVTQEVRPVQERIETIVAKGTGDMGGSGGGDPKSYRKGY